MIDETTDWDELTPREKLESQRGRCGATDLRASRKYGGRIGTARTCARF